MRTFSKSSKFGKSDSGRSSGGKSFGKPRGESRFGAGRRDAARSSSGGRSKSSGESFTATCDKCGKTTDLPFKPTGAKPVYCRTCFKGGEVNNERSFDRSNSRDRNDRFESRDNSSEEMDKINAKLDKIMRALKIN